MENQDHGRALGGVGRHVIADLYGCCPQLLNDSAQLLEIAMKAVNISGGTIQGHISKVFTPQGATGIILISESHFSYHSWPEYGYLAVDYFTCGSRVDTRKGIAYFVEQLQPDRYDVKQLDRGEEVVQDLRNSGMCT